MYQVADPVPKSYVKAFAAIDNDPRHELVVVELDGEVIGTAHLTLFPSLSYQGSMRTQIEAVRVDRRYRSQGIGTHLFRWLIDRAHRDLVWRSLRPTHSPTIDRPCMYEIDVIRQTRAFLQRDGLLGHHVLDLYTDAHPTLLADTALRPFQRFTLAFEGFAVHPDLVGRLSDGETTFVVEAKGADDLLRGIAQADTYRPGFHLVLFASAGTPLRDLLAIARRHDVGVLAVYPVQVEVLALPPPHLPQLRHARSIQQQFVATTTLSHQFTFNLPTHYLCFVPLLAAWHQQAGATWADLAVLEPFARERYPVLPAGRTSFRAALSGAEKLGLVSIRGQQAQLTDLGWSVAPLLPDASSLAAIHQCIAPRGAPTLARESPAAGAVLRILLHGDPVARFVIETLSVIGVGQSISLRSLVIHAAERDQALAAVVFFQPEAIATITDDQGHLVWRRIQPEHFRSTTFLQYKSVLKHAGVLAPHRLGRVSTRGYDQHPVCRRDGGPRDLQSLLGAIDIYARGRLHLPVHAPALTNKHQPGGGRRSRRQVETRPRRASRHA